ncbi:Fic family protein [Geochorda subterranea]|uniref:Uncharacterized protein n=1 Tax=Geochorda subterranea TaxID=3109564 RepID=A0ABZ1BSU4_9FIRM|nr:hypothetical protein [Limnochorda sp. LNt]WRP15217.1 hypothetical protein VLY81_03335 [Limnochorda sp. LNt]
MLLARSHTQKRLKPENTDAGFALRLGPGHEAACGVFKVVFLRDPYTPERLRALGLLDQQIRAVLYAKEKGAITNREYRELVGVKERTATEDLARLVTMGILQKSGITGRGMRYVIRKTQNPH